MTVTRMIARPLLSSMFVVGGLDTLRNAPDKVDSVKPVTDKAADLVKRAAPQAPVPTDTVTLVRLNGAAMVLAGAALATGKAPRVSAAVLAATLLPTTAAGHRFWEVSDPGMRANQRVHFFKNVSMLGGLLIAAVDTDGKPGLAWRARRTARQTRRQMRKAAKH